ncbi:signal protein [Embleya sp. NPDC020886]|uniref:signal protein n=1 Tax=Embleya sp. NPDC020886 TaxID=3363980 RepID=UPI0037B826FF
MKIARSLALLVGALTLITACTSDKSSSSNPAGPKSTPPSVAPPSAGSAAPAAPAEATEAASATPIIAVDPNNPNRPNLPDLQARWWAWAAKSTSGTNPLADRNGEQCDRNQATTAWYLAGSSEGPAIRRCRMVTRAPVAFPVVNLKGTQAECARFMADAKGSVELDGKQIRPDRFDAAPIRFTGVEGNAITGNAEEVNTYACGLWVQLAPLGEGTHTLAVRGSAGTVTTVVDYTLNVTAR